MSIETDRLILREFKRSDWQDVHAYASDEEVARFMEWGPNSEQETIAFVERCLEHQRAKPRYVFDFLVTLKEKGAVIGTCGITVLAHDVQQGVIGYCYNRQYWRQGFASEASAALLKLGFSQLELLRIFATCDADNIGSASVLRKVGMRQEAHFVQDKKIKGRWRDTLLFAVLKGEHEERQRG